MQSYDKNPILHKNYSLKKLKTATLAVSIWYKAVFLTAESQFYLYSI